MSNIRPAGSLSGMPPSSSAQPADIDAAETLLALRTSAPRREQVGQASSLNEAPASTSSGMAAFSPAIAAGRSTQRNLLLGLAENESGHEKIHSLHSGSSIGDASFADPSASNTSIQRGRRLAIDALLSSEKAEVPHGGRTQTASGSRRATSPRRSSSSGSGLSIHLYQQSQTSQAGHAGGATSDEAAAAGKGKGKARDPGTPAGSYTTGDKRQLPSSPSEGMPPEKRINRGSTPIAAQETAAAAAATPSGQHHPYMEIRPLSQVAAQLTDEKSLLEIWNGVAEVSNPNARSVLSRLEDHLRSEGISNTMALSNFHYFQSRVNDYLKTDLARNFTQDITVLRRVRNDIFRLPSQAQIEKIAPQIGPGTSVNNRSNLKTLTDAAGRLDELLVAELPIEGSLYEGEHARERFLTVKHQLTQLMDKKEITSDTNVAKVLHILRKALYSLPLDDALHGILNRARASLTEPKRSRYETPGMKVVTTLAEIAFMNAISEDEMIFALREWKDAKSYLLAATNLKRTKKRKAEQFNAALTARQKEVFEIIHTALNEWEPSLNDYEHMNPLSSYLAMEHQQAAPSGSGIGS